MKDVGEAIASVIILGIGLSITISAVASGRLFSLWEWSLSGRDLG